MPIPYIDPNSEDLRQVMLSVDALLNAAWALEDAANAAKDDNHLVDARLLIENSNKVRKTLGLVPVSLKT